MQTSECSVQWGTTNSEERERLYRDTKIWSRLSLLSEADERLKTFAGWSYPVVSPRDLADAGFFALRDGDRVQCFFCKGRFRGWGPNDVPAYTHRKYFPKCRFVCGLATVPIGNSKPKRAYDVNGQYCGKGPAYPYYSSYKARLRTFKGWENPLHDTKQSLAQCGFYYAGTSDHMRCFYCDLGIRNLEQRESPLEVHQRCRPKCMFLITLKHGPKAVKAEVTGPLPQTGHASQATGSPMKTTDEPKTGNIYCGILDSCIVCIEKRREVIFQPCFHIVACRSCSKLVAKCPYCRGRIFSTNTVYVP